MPTALAVVAAPAPAKAPASGTVSVSGEGVCPNCKGVLRFALVPANAASAQAMAKASVPTVSSSPTTIQLKLNLRPFKAAKRQTKAEAMRGRGSKNGTSPVASAPAKTVAATPVASAVALKKA